MAAISLPAVASAAAGTTTGTNTATFKPTFVPIKKFSGTGNILGAGTAVHTVFNIGSTAPPGATGQSIPSQLKTVTVRLPKGFGVHLSSFSSCAATLLQDSGPEACPKNSIATPPGIGHIEAPLGSSIIQEDGSIQGFVAPGGGLNFYLNGTAPISAQLVSQGSFQSDSGAFGKKIVVTVPDILSVPGAPNASTTHIDLLVGSAIKKGKKTIYGATVPKKCPSGGFKWEADITYADGTSTTSPAVSPCPKKKK
ncbi:MAG TPA: hypothetical protein VLJ42_03775 [Solirubrobacteraceae bacterium]|nr:hypothetical protein [Solirubrobacteraceae bacterium]